MPALFYSIMLSFQSDKATRLINEGYQLEAFVYLFQCLHGFSKNSPVFKQLTPDDQQTILNVLDVEKKHLKNIKSGNNKRLKPFLVTMNQLLMRLSGDRVIKN